MTRSGFVRFFRRLLWVMGWFGVLVCFEVSCISSPQSPEKDGLSSVSQSIIQGQPDLTQPAIGALVVQRRSSFCTGTLITRQVVVTAAHCVDAINRYGLSNVTFRTDVADAQQKFLSEYHELQLVAKHPQYVQSSGADYDIAVLILKNKAQNVTPIPANQTAMEQKWLGTTVHVVGYGLIQTQPSNRSADQKYAADIPLFRIDARSFIHYDSQTPKEQRKSACHGDSGGPSLYQVDGKIRVLGVTSIAYLATASSGGQTLCDGGAVSTRTDANYDFLRPFLSKYGDGPEACKTDQECGPCDSCGQKLVCEPKTFQTESKHCRPCQTDNDCGTGICYRFAQGFRCLQACTTAGCCPTGSLCNTLAGVSRSVSVCEPETACGPIVCQNDAECGPGETCQQNTCQPNIPPRSPELCQPCTTYAQCGVGLCYGPQGNGRCTQPCATGDFCPQGFVCRALYPGLPNQCMPQDDTCRIPCAQDDHCPANFACLNKFCSRKGGGIHGDTCDPMPCQEGLECVVTASGKNCMQPCGIKAGYGGTSCSTDNQCFGNTRCYKTDALQVCLAACQTTTDCTAKGGGTCSQIGNCLCRQQSDCASGYTCNFFTYSGGAVGACVPQEGILTCRSDFECRGFADKDYCVPKGSGSRAVGEECDSLNRCKEGLVCLNTGSGSTCFEDCTQTQTCTLGGSCARVGRSTSICLCEGNFCPQGRVCRTAIQGYGVCQPQARASNQRVCIDQRDCPPFHDCKEGKCLPGTIPQPEPISEPTSEPTPEPTSEPATETVMDAGQESTTSTEPVPEKTVSPEITAQSDQQETADTALPPPPKQGCGCSTLSSPTPPSAALVVLLCLGLAFFSTRRRRMV